MLKLLFIILSWFGWTLKPPEPANDPAAPTALPRTWRFPRKEERIKSRAEQARDALEVIYHYDHAHVHGVPRPTAQQVGEAWPTLEEADLKLAGLVAADRALGIPVPRCPSGANVQDWFDRTCNSVKTVEVLTGVWHGAKLRSWRGLEDVAAREIERRLGGLNPVIIHLDGPPERREVHLRDSVRSEQFPRGRVLSCRMWEHGENGPLEVLDHPGGKLARDTVDRSRWLICAGWVVSGPRGAGRLRRPAEQDEGAVNNDNNPPTNFNP